MCKAADSYVDVRIPYRQSEDEGPHEPVQVGEQRGQAHGNGQAQLYKEIAHLARVVVPVFTSNRRLFG